MKYIPGPDFPTAGIIIGKDIIKQGYKTGRGSIKIRGDLVIATGYNYRNAVILVGRR